MLLPHAVVLHQDGLASFQLSLHVNKNNKIKRAYNYFTTQGVVCVMHSPFWQCRMEEQELLRPLYKNLSQKLDAQTEIYRAEYKHLALWTILLCLTSFVTFS